MSYVYETILADIHTLLCNVQAVKMSINDIFLRIIALIVEAWTDGVWFTTKIDTGNKETLALQYKGRKRCDITKFFIFTGVTSTEWRVLKSSSDKQNNAFGISIDGEACGINISVIHDARSIIILVS